MRRVWKFKERNGRGRGGNGKDWEENEGGERGLASTFQGLLMPLKNAGIHMGSTTASFRSFFASSRSAMLSLKRQTKLQIHPGDPRSYSGVRANHVFPQPTT